MRMIITGASGLVGSETLRRALDHREVSAVTALVRSPLQISHPKLEVVIHKNFLSYEQRGELFANHEACIWCLGISQSRVSANEYFIITHDYALAAARAAYHFNPEMVFSFVSAMGADPTGRIPLRFARVKGQTESALASVGLHHLNIFRPGAVLHNPGQKQPGWYKYAERLMMRFFSLAFPSRSIRVADLARIILNITVAGGPGRIYHQAELSKRSKTSET